MLIVVKDGEKFKTLDIKLDLKFDFESGSIGD
jgi:hypothetical protein